MSSTASPSLNASREYVARTSSGYLMLLLLLVVVAIGFLAFFGQDASRHRALCASLHPDRQGILHAAAQPGRGDHAVRELPRHRPRDRPALGLAMDGQAEAFDPRQQHHFGDDQGQRSARKSDRDGGAGGLARDRHGAGAVRRRGLQGVRQGSDRGGGAHHRLALPLRRFRAPGGDAARQQRPGANRNCERS